MTAKPTPGIYAPDGSLYITPTDGNGNLVDLSAGTSGVAGGDLSGTYPNPGVAKVAGVAPGTGVATALGVAVGSAGAVVVNGGALGTPSSGVATNLTGTATGLTAGHVTTNANLTGDVTSVGNATTIANKTGTGSVALSDSPIFTTLLSLVGDGTASNISLDRYSAAATSNNISLRKARGSLASPAAVLGGDGMGTLQWLGYDGFLFRQVGVLSYTIDTITGNNDLSSYLTFFTRNDGDGGVTERVRLTKTGGLNVGAYTTDPGAGNVKITGSYTGAGTGLTGTAAALTAGNVTAGWHTLKKATTDQTTANTAAKVTSWSVTIPANTLNANGAVRLSAVFKFVNTNGTKQVGVDFGGTTLWSSAATASTTLGYVSPSITIYNRNSASSQVAVLTNTNASSSTTVPATSSIDTTQDQTLTFWITLGSSSDTGVLQAGLVEYNNDNP